jgi:MarR family transcriptional regulator, lower aerobic nicotinate degradation pathway regulator
MLVRPTTATLARVPGQPPRHASAPARIHDLPTWLISRAYARSHGLLNDGFAASGTGLRSYHYRLLAALEESGPVVQAELGRNTSVDPSDVVAVLSELERRGLVQRTTDPSNRRRNIVSITRTGSKQLRALDEVLEEIQERVLAPLSHNERRQLTKLLRKVGDASDAG